MARSLLDVGVSPNDVSIHDDSVLIRTCDEGNLERVGLLVEFGANVNYQEVGGDEKHKSYPLLENDT